MRCGEATGDWLWNGPNKETLTYNYTPMREGGSRLYPGIGQSLDVWSPRLRLRARPTLYRQALESSQAPGGGAQAGKGACVGHQGIPAEAHAQQREDLWSTLCSRHSAGV